ncbi:hemagglutinin repeat-containing protein [Haemophilus parainfluenzae]|uniref:hemagglutinin repeat-containing protein n=1 Tax=Haemophilus parainfluenzae TaxID=729 RepID=UPI001FB3F4C9|nr:hemagglutinin repeat-containing protein [Haemophilus parainfluenzae]
MGKTLYLGDSAVSANANHKDLVAGATKLINEDKIGEIHRVDDGKYGQLLSYRDKNPVRRRYGHKTVWEDDYHHEHATDNFNFNVVKNNIGDLAAVKEASSQSTIGARNEADAVGAVNNAVRLPNASLYKINQDPQSRYVVETDPKFADKRTWLSSDYMFNALKNDPQNMLKRLGDGYYEQRLINEQINQLTGKRFLDGHDNDYAQYKSLMDNGVLYAKKWQLVPGVALTEAQMKELTSDLVWFEKQETVLPNGQKVSVLAPKVYLAPRNVKVNGEGAIISANKVVINGIQEVENSGTILGNEGVSINAENITNDKGRVQGDVVLLQAENTLKNIGGVIEGKDAILAKAKKVQIEGSVSETQDDGKFHQKIIGKAAEINLTNKEGEVQIYADENITVKGAKANIAGDAVFNAKGKLELGALDTHNKEHYGSGDKYYRLDQEMQVGNQLNVGGDVNYIGGEKVSIVGNDLHADGNALIASKGDIEIKEGRNKEQLSSGVKTVDKGLSEVTRVIKHEHDYDLAQASTLDANKIRIQSDGNISVQGSNVVAESGLAVAGKNIDIKEAENRVYSEDFSMTKKSGLLGGGIGFTIGKQKQTLENDQTRLYASGSQVGSLNNNTTIVAENAYTQTASIVSAIKGDVNILAKKADVKAADDKYETNTKQTFEQKGLTIAITSPIISAIQAVQGAIESTKQVGDSKHGRVNTMSAANAGFDAYRAADSVMNAGDSIQKAMSNSNVDSVVGVQITYGQQKSESRTHTEGKTVAKSQVNAGGKVNIVATGTGKDSNINIKGSDISGKQGTTLIADNQVNIKATEQNHQERSTNKSSGFNAGVAIKVSNGVAAGITVGGNYGKGYGNGDETSYVASHVGDSQSKTVIQAGGDANIIGSQVKGKRVELNAENLNIESLQDKSSYHGKQMNVSGSVTVGYGFAAGGSFSKSKINADHASVNEQAGIFAGNDGYDINVKNKVSSVGGAIISSAEKEKNQMTAQDFEYSNIQNYSNAKSSAMGLMGGFSVDRDQTSDEDKALNKIYRGEDRKSETFEQANPNKANQLPVKFGLGTNDVHSTDLYAAAKIGLANLASNSSQSENNQSTTNAVISDGNFNIASMQGKQNIETIKKSTEQDANKLEKVDHAELQKEVEQDVATIQRFAKNVGGATDEAYRTMFIAEHRMFTHKVDEKGEPIKDPEILKKIDEEADTKGIARDVYLQQQLDKGRNIYQLHELSDQERNQLQKVTYTDPKTGKTESKYVVAFNGIFNNHNAAAKFAVQNYIAGRDDKTGNIDQKIYKDVYFVHHPEAKNGLSELLVAGYEKMFETSFGNLLGMDNSSLQAMNIMKQYGKDDLYLGSHSRGTLTLSNALKALNTEDNRDKKLLSGTTIKMVGPAADVTRADGYLSQLQTGKERTTSDGSIRIENHASDPVGSMPILLGGNPATTTENDNNNSWLKLKVDMFRNEVSSVHNCHGLGQPQCVDDGYRKKTDLKMGNETTIFELNNMN